MASEEKEIIGYAECPFCGEEAEIRGNKKGKAYYNCDCGTQVFFRTAKADATARAHARPTKKGEVKKNERLESVQKGAGGDKPAGGKKDDWWDD